MLRPHEIFAKAFDLALGLDEVGVTLAPELLCRLHSLFVDRGDAAVASLA